jgi:hypothetical protein
MRAIRRLTDPRLFRIVICSCEEPQAAIYRMPNAESDSVIPACADSPDRFLFLGTSKDNHLEVVRYVAR